MINKRTQIVMVLVLSALLFYVNIPPTSMDSFNLNLTSSAPSDLNLTQYTIEVNETTPLLDFEGNVIANITRTVNKTITPEVPLETNILLVVLNLGGTLFPSQPIVGWVIILSLVYFLIWPLLLGTKRLIWGE